MANIFRSARTATTNWHTNRAGIYLVRDEARVRVPGRGGSRREPKPEVISPSGKNPPQFRDKTPLSLEQHHFARTLEKNFAINRGYTTAAGLVLSYTACINQFLK